MAWVSQEWWWKPNDSKIDEKFLKFRNKKNFKNREKLSQIRFFPLEDNCFIFLGSKIIVDSDCSYEIKGRLLLGRKVITDLDSIFKIRDITLPTKIHLVKALVFPIVMCGCELDHKEGWVPKNWCLWIMVLEQTCESILDCKIKSVNLKGSQHWILIGRTDAKAETPILWPPDMQGQQRIEWLDWHHWLNEHEFEQSLGDSEEQGSLVCYSPWNSKELDRT